mmetsp:Transcript_6130/g.9247  ORF Transcript_6130/g.9247 Transcript_6130/m.9247 type:complete len:200 (-) Transcript_6130:209-808(-)
MGAGGPRPHLPEFSFHRNSSLRYFLRSKTARYHKVTSSPVTTFMNRARINGAPPGATHSPITVTISPTLIDGGGRGVVGGDSTNSRIFPWTVEVGAGFAAASAIDAPLFPRRDDEERLRTETVCNFLFPCDPLPINGVLEPIVGWTAAGFRTESPESGSPNSTLPSPETERTSPVVLMLSFPLRKRCSTREVGAFPVRP